MRTTTNRYRPLLRPPSSATLPEGLEWCFVEAPWELTTRPDLPRSTHRYGIIETARPLTQDELDRFGLAQAE